MYRRMKTAAKYFNSFTIAVIIRLSKIPRIHSKNAPLEIISIRYVAFLLLHKLLGAHYIFWTIIERAKKIFLRNRTVP